MEMVFVRLIRNKDMDLYYNSDVIIFGEKMEIKVNKYKNEDFKIEISFYNGYIIVNCFDTTKKTFKEVVELIKNIETEYLLLYELIVKKTNNSIIDLIKDYDNNKNKLMKYLEKDDIIFEKKIFGLNSIIYIQYFSSNNMYQYKLDILHNNERLLKDVLLFVSIGSLFKYLDDIEKVNTLKTYYKIN
jgi:hypothetical protein